MRNPIGIDYACPRLSWNFSEGSKQSAYQILAMDEDGDMLWDSGKVESQQMHLIPWGGANLKSRSEVFWKVTIWDEKDEAETSDTAHFELERRVDYRRLCSKEKRTLPGGLFQKKFCGKRRS